MVFDSASLRGRRGEALSLACRFNGLRLLRGLVLGFDVAVGYKIGTGVVNNVLDRLAYPAGVFPESVLLARVADIRLTKPPGPGGHRLPALIGRQQDSILRF